MQSDLLSQLTQGASHFKGCWRNLHRLEFPSVRRYSVLHAKPSDFTDAGTHEAICYPTVFTSVCQRTMQYIYGNNKVSSDFIPSLAKGTSRSRRLNSTTVLEVFHHFNIIIAVACIGVAVFPVECNSYVILFLHIQPDLAQAS